MSKKKNTLKEYEKRIIELCAFRAVAGMALDSRYQSTYGDRIKASLESTKLLAVKKAKSAMIGRNMAIPGGVGLIGIIVTFSINMNDAVGNTAHWMQSLIALVVACVALFVIPAISAGLTNIFYKPDEKAIKKAARVEANSIQRNITKNYR